MTHDPVEDLLGVYALDALDDEERARVDAHLADCPRCRAEVDGHREVAAQLALSGAPAPLRVWDRIADAIDGTDAGVTPPLRLVVGDRVDEAGAPAPAWRRFAGIAAVAAAAVAIVSLGVSTVSQGNRIDDFERGQDVAVAATQAFSSSDARVTALTTGDGTILGRAAVLPDGNGYLLADALPDLPDGTYQLWGDTGEEVVSLGAIGAAPTVRSFTAAGNLTRLMITAEAEPVPAPTTAPLVVGNLT
jgi:anti-sigma factor RsiW